MLCTLIEKRSVKNSFKISTETEYYSIKYRKHWIFYFWCYMLHAYICWVRYTQYIYFHFVMKQNSCDFFSFFLLSFFFFLKEDVLNTSNRITNTVYNMWLFTVIKLYWSVWMACQTSRQDGKGVALEDSKKHSHDNNHSTL